MIKKTTVDVMPEKEFFLVLDQFISRWRIMEVKNLNGRYFQTDANMIFGYDLSRFTHWTELPEKP